MHPAFSVIFFTTASGAGYGLLILLGLGAAGNLLPPDKVFVLAAGVSALALVTAGLLSSTFHLGHPERAWRALSQWRSSWLSREGVLALLTYIPAVLLMLGWFGGVLPSSIISTTGLVTAVFALATVFTTSMIYASLKSIHAWSNVWVPVNYLLLALASGAVVFNAFVIWFEQGSAALSLLALVLLGIAFAAKLSYWHYIDTNEGPSSAATALGVDAKSSVRLTQAPHSETNYLQQEMGFEIARKHAKKLRNIAAVAGFIAPGVLSLAAASGHQLVALGAATLAVPLLATGLLVERWLFFAEAKHTVSLYYR